MTIEAPPINTLLTDYNSVEIDLNGDGLDELVVRATDQYWCGTGGCTMFVASQQGGELKVISRTTITQLPIKVLATKTNGWNDLAVSQNHFGGPSELKRLQFDGCSYPLNPSVPPATRLEYDVGETILDDPAFKN